MIIGKVGFGLLMEEQPSGSLSPVHTWEVAEVAKFDLASSVVRATEIFLKYCNHNLKVNTADFQGIIIIKKKKTVVDMLDDSRASEHFTWKLSNQNQPGLILIDSGCSAG